MHVEKLKNMILHWLTCWLLGSIDVDGRVEHVADFRDARLSHKRPWRQSGRRGRRLHLWVRRLQHRTLPSPATHWVLDFPWTRLRMGWSKTNVIRAMICRQIERSNLLACWMHTHRLYGCIMHVCMNLRLRRMSGLRVFEFVGQLTPVAQRLVPCPHPSAPTPSLLAKQMGCANESSPVICLL